MLRLNENKKKLYFAVFQQKSPGNEVAEFTAQILDKVPPNQFNSKFAYS